MELSENKLDNLNMNTTVFLSLYDVSETHVVILINLLYQLKDDI